MRLLRRLVGLTVLLLSAAGIVCCLAGAAGAWVFRQAASEKVNAISARLDVGLQRASAANQNVRRALEKASADVDRAGREPDGPGGGNAKGRLAAGALRRSLRRDVLPEMNDLGGRLATCADVAVAVSSLLGSYQEVTPGQAGRIQPDRLERLAGQASQFSAALQRLQAAVGDGDREATEKEVVNASSEVAAVLQKCQRTVDGWQSDLDGAREELSRVRAEALGWLTLVAVAVSALCAWVGVSQVSLFAHAWGWCRA
jgi:hypothetical protein